MDISLIRSLDKHFHRKQGTMFMLLGLVLPSPFVLLSHLYCVSLQSFPVIGVSFPVSCCLGSFPAGREPSPGLKGVRLDVHWTAGYWPQQDIPRTQVSSLLPRPSPLPRPNKPGLRLPPSLSASKWSPLQDAQREVLFQNVSSLAAMFVLLKLWKKKKSLPQLKL